MAYQRSPSEDREIMELLRISDSTAIATRPVVHVLRWLGWHLSPPGRRAPGRSGEGAALRFYSSSAGTLPDAVRVRERI
jgi:hypothetical protein